MYMYQQKSTITNLLGKQHFNSNNEYIGGKNINRYIQQGNPSEIKLLLYTEQRWRLFFPSVVELFWWGIVIFRDLIAAVSASFWEKMLPSLQRKFQRCWMHACYDALEVRHMFACNMFQNTIGSLVKTSYFTLPSLTDITPAIRPITCFVQTKFIFVSKHCFYL